MKFPLQRYIWPIFRLLILVGADEDGGEVPLPDLLPEVWEGRLEAYFSCNLVLWISILSVFSPLGRGTSAKIMGLKPGWKQAQRASQGSTAIATILQAHPLCSIFMSGKPRLKEPVSLLQVRTRVLLGEDEVHPLRRAVRARRLLDGVYQRLVEVCILLSNDYIL